MGAVIDNERTPLRERGGRVVGNIIDGIVIEGMGEEVAVDEIVEKLRSIEFQDDTGQLQSITVKDRDIEIRQDRRDKMKATVVMENNQAWTALEVLRRNKIRVEPFIEGDKLLQRRKIQISSDDESDDEFHDSNADITVYSHAEESIIIEDKESKEDDGQTNLNKLRLVDIDSL